MTEHKSEAPVLHRLNVTPPWWSNARDLRRIHLAIHTIIRSVKTLGVMAMHFNLDSLEVEAWIMEETAPDSRAMRRIREPTAEQVEAARQRALEALSSTAFLAMSRSAEDLARLFQKHYMANVVPSHLTVSFDNLEPRDRALLLRVCEAMMEELFIDPYKEAARLT